MGSRRWTIRSRLGLVLVAPAVAAVFLATAPTAAAEQTDTAEEAVFEMREVSIFGRGESRDFNRLTRGQHAECETEPNEDVKAYPKLESKRPYYGTVTFGRSPYEPDSGMKFHFVIDESGEGAASGGEESEAAHSVEAPSLLEQLAAALGGGSETPPKKTPVILPITYDRLYFDVNRDLDLTNDPVLEPMKSPPPEAIPSWDARQKVVYDSLSVEFDYGAELGNRPFQILPRLFVREHEGEEYAYVYFMATTARKGRIQIGSRKYDAILGQPYLVTGRFDRPFTGLFLDPVDSSDQREYWWGHDQLSAMRQVDGKYYTTSTTPTGDKIIIKPYRGEFGILEIGPGERDLEVDKLGISGSLMSQDAAVAVGTPSSGSPSYDKARRCELPVGDYLPNLVSIEFGRLRMSISNNYHSDGNPRGGVERPPVFGIEIRKDKPFVWDFSNQPEVMFASPAKDATFARGDEVQVKGVLTDPKLDIMIRGLDDTTRSKEQTIEIGGGRTSTFERPLSLDPTVTITDSSGKQVAQGTMPFG